MITVWFIVIPLAGGLAAWAAGRTSDRAARWISLAAMGLDLALALLVWAESPAHVEIVGGGAWLAQVRWPWIPELGASFHLAMDGLSLLLVTLTALLGLVSVAASWTGIRERVGFFHGNLLVILAGITGVFLATDLLLFYAFWELMLVPMYFLIDIWGHEKRHYAAVKFFLFTQLGGLAMLLAIVGLYFIHGRATGEYTFDYARLLGTPLAPSTAMLLMLGFLAAFLVKLPAVPLHTWLPDAHTEAPTGGSVILAGLLLKTGAYGLIRFAVPLFPQAAERFAAAGMVLGAIGILYGAVLAFAQTDLKRLVAYTSVSHLGFVLLGVFAWNRLALQGAVMQMICHGISTGALFILAGVIQDRLGTRDMGRMGGLWAVAPRLGAVGMLFAMASLGLPGLGNFVAEFLILLGAYEVSLPITAVAAGGLVLATVYSLALIYRVFHGEAREPWRAPDLSAREMAVFVVLIAAIVWLGLFPQPVLDTAGGAIDGLFKTAPATVAGGMPTPSYAWACTRGIREHAHANGGVGMPPGAEEVRDTKKLSQNCGTPAPGRAGWPQNTAEGGCATRKGCSEIVSKDHGYAAARGQATRRSLPISHSALRIPHFPAGGAP
jgi:NADH-quinone oxidoreductase subunit M